MNGFRNVACVVFMALIGANLLAQIAVTPYDKLPGNIVSHKPVYSDDLPDWAKMLYQYPINYNELKAQYDLYVAQNGKVKNSYTRYFKNWSRIVGNFADPQGVIHVENLDKVRYTRTQNGARSGGDWKVLGPIQTFYANGNNSPEAPPADPSQVNIYCVDVAISNTDVLYCGTETGFVNKTVDKGLNWRMIGSDYAFGGGVTAIAVDPKDENIVYAAAGNQVHKTSDGGKTWRALLPSNLFYADEIVINPNNTNIIMAASSEGLWRTVDAGSTWQQILTNRVFDIKFNVESADIVYAISQVGNSFDFQISTNGGQSFQANDAFPKGIQVVDGARMGVTMANKNKIIIVMLSDRPEVYKGLYSGSDWSWTKVASGGTTELEMDNGQGYYDFAVDMSQTNENEYIVATTTCFKTINDGISFTPIGGYYGPFDIHPDIQDIKILPNGDTWIATDGGMNYSSDGFESKANHSVRTNGIIGSDFWGFDQGWNEDIVVGGRYHNGNTAIADFYNGKALSMGGAESPTGWVLHAKSRHVAFDDLGGGWILPSTAEGPIEGNFIFSKYPNMDEYGGRRSNLITHPVYNGTLYLGNGNDFWISNDYGQSYDLLYSFPGRVMYINVSYSNPNVLYADIDGYGLYRSEDGGRTWVLKPALTNSNHLGNYSKGKLFFAISPYSENVLYACLQNGTWSDDLGKVYKSNDGGNTWTNWTEDLNLNLKSIVVQPTSNGKDLVYLFATASSHNDATVYTRGEEDANWELFNTNYPVGERVNIAMPFFRDSKIRVAGNTGVLECTMKEPDFEPIIMPWTGRQHVSCYLDTIQFDDHSILNHSGASWSWTISPSPSYISDAQSRNPRVVLGNEGSYDVALRVTQNGNTYTKTIPAMVTATKCPSLDNCNNPAFVPKKDWKVVSFDSEETIYPGTIDMAFDDDVSTIWHTRWATGTDPYPHEFQISLGNKYDIHEFTYLPRQVGENGRIRKYELYIGNDSLDFGAPVKIDSFENSSGPQTIKFDPPIEGKFFSLKALSEVNGGPWASIAELYVKACYSEITQVDNIATKFLQAYPIPASSDLRINIPYDGKVQVSIISTQGNLVQTLASETIDGKMQIPIQGLPSGTYFILITGDNGKVFRAKMVKM
ncbi:MAG: discoidin domain-containing protein [Saprospiraceae bacterium]|nr:discoidin domain-containing protein [Saprospiraceae bacterium]